jgi:uncharacterized surface protein with fasciclin (FAS1) repeats
MRIPVTLTGILLLAACGGSATATTVEPDVATTTAPVAVSADILDMAMEHPELSTFLGALDSAGIMDGLHGEGPFTVFAPSNAAFADYFGMMDMTEAEVFGDQQMLAGLLNNHVVSGMSDPSEMVMGMAGQEFTSVSGLALMVTVDGDDVTINEALIIDYDIEGTNGVIHVIDHVLAST